MADLTLPIIGLTTLAGYFFSKDGKNPRQVEVKRDTVEKFEMPNGQNIYASNKVEEVNKEILERSLKNYADAENPEMTGMLPPLVNTFGMKGAFSKQNQVPALSIQERAALDTQQKVDDIKQTAQPPNIEQRPMFTSELRKDVEYRGDTTQLYSDINQSSNEDVSLLTGLPYTKSHSNMTPFFGSNVRQNIEEFSNQPLLDVHTGNTTTFKHKKEVEKFFQEQQQDIHGTPIYTQTVDTDRYIPSSYRQNEKVIEQEHIQAPKAGTFDNNIRPQFRSVDELRLASNPQTSYEGRTIAGQMAIGVRGIQSEQQKHRPDTFYEQGQDHLLKTTGQFTAPTYKQDFTTNLKATSRKDYNLSYFGGASADNKRDYQKFGTEEREGETFVQESKRHNFKNDYLGHATGSKGANDYGKDSFVGYETQRATTGQQMHVTNAKSSTGGFRVLPSDQARETLKQTTLSFDNSGNVKTKFDKGAAGAYDAGITDIKAKTTSKETTIVNNYKGIANKGEGSYINKYEAKTTGKEMMLQEYSGTAHMPNEAKSRQNYQNAEIRSNKQELVSGERASGPQKFQIGSGKDILGETKRTQNALLKEQSNSRVQTQFNSPVVPSSVFIGNTTRQRDTRSQDNSRLQPELVNSQHANNPYSIYGKNKN